MKKDYLRLSRLQGALIEVEGVTEAHNGEIIRLRGGGKDLVGQVVKLFEEQVTIQVFGDTQGLGVTGNVLTFEQHPFEIPLSLDVLGRSFNGIGEPIDGGGPVYADAFYNINGRPMNPVARSYPRDFIQTGISAIDGLMTLIRGQKLPIFSGAGLAHNALAAQILRQAKLKSGDDKFSFVFCAIGVKNDEAAYFDEAFKSAGVSEKVTMVVNKADDPIMERLIAPKVALTVAEYLAFEHNRHVLVILTDITAYGEALREISSLREEVPSRKGYPGYLYSDLAQLYERAGMLRDASGSVTLVPILTMPNDDITHPIPDLTGYITEGQITLSRELTGRGIYPAIDVLPSLSRLMKDGIGAGYTREDHEDLANQLFASYSRVEEVRNLAQIVGAEDLSERDRKVLNFGEAFEQQYVAQGEQENREIEETLDLGWQLLKLLPREELTRVKPEFLDRYME